MGRTSKTVNLTGLNWPIHMNTVWVYENLQKFYLFYCFGLFILMEVTSLEASNGSFWKTGLHTTRCNAQQQ